MSTPSKSLRKDVEDALAWAPNIDERRIGVATEDGIVTLTGHVPSFAEKMAAERVVKRLYGVKAVANDLAIDLPDDAKRTDTEIAEAIVRSLKWDVMVPDERIQATVRNGWVTLEGKVEWQYQREATRDAVRNLAGVKGLTNNVEVTSPLKPERVREKIEAALVRDAHQDARKIRVETEDHTVILRGVVDSWSDRDEVENAAWSAPGVWRVEDHLTVAPRAYA